MDKPARLTKKRWGEKQINKIRNEKGEVTTDIAEIQKKNKRILWTIVCQQIWQPGRNGQLYTDIQSAKTEPPYAVMQP